MYSIYIYIYICVFFCGIHSFGGIKQQLGPSAEVAGLSSSFYARLARFASKSGHSLAAVLYDKEMVLRIFETHST